MFKPTIAILLDFSISQLPASGVAHHVQLRDRFAQAWIRVADASSSQGLISDALSDVNKLQAIVKIQPLEISDYDFTCKATTSEVEMPEAHKPMLLFAQLLESESACIAAAAERALEKISLPNGAKLPELAKRLQLLTDTRPTTKD